MAKTATTPPNHQVLMNLLKIVVVGSLFIFIILLGLYQGLVDKNHTPLRLSTLVSADFWHQLATQSWSQDPQFLGCDDPRLLDTSSQIYTDTNFITTDCENGCYFTITEQDTAKYGPESRVPLITEADMKFDPKVKAAELLGADLNKGRLVYFVPQYQRIYYTEMTVRNDPYLWHEINLSPDQKDPIRFVAIKRSTVGYDFLVAYSQARQELYLYGLDTLWLRKIKLNQPLNFDTPQRHDTSICVKIVEPTTGEHKNWNILTQP